MTGELTENRNNPKACLVTIVTPVLNGIKYLEANISNVLDQDYPNIEHLFIDGGSTDGTLEILEKYAAEYPGKIRYISEPDEGVGDAVNKGFKLGNGKIFGWLDTDDLYEKNTVRSVVEFFTSNPKAYFLYGNCNIIDENNVLIGTFPVRDFDLKDIVAHRHYVVFCSSFYRREVVEKTGGLNPLGNDLDFWLRVNEHYHLHRTDKILCNWRQHADSISFSTGKRQRAMVRQRIREDYLLGRKYGGSIFTERSLRYYRYAILDRLGVYFYLNYTLLPRFRKWPAIDKILRLLKI